ncbi:MAG: hypothetical protein ACUVQ8_05050 [Nitrososphaeria archaeon]
MKKIVFAIVMLLISLNLIGYSLACSNGGIEINWGSNCNAAFVKVTTSDNEDVKDVGNVRAQISCDRDTIQMYVANAYPNYEAYVSYVIQNVGCKPIHIDVIKLTDTNPTAIEVINNDLVCTWLGQYQKVQGLTTIRVVQAAKENWMYDFKVEIGFFCQIGYPRTIGFWKNQFNVALRIIRGTAQVPPNTLEGYLNQISQQSNIFEFTGTRTSKFKQALAILIPSSSSNMELKLKSQLLALWLNYVAGWTDGYNVKGMTAQQIIQGSENALLNHQTWKYEYWKNLCDTFNNIGGG